MEESIQIMPHYLENLFLVMGNVIEVTPSLRKLFIQLYLCRTKRYFCRGKAPRIPTTYLLST